mmetsp:Transcript_56791/g.92458  ORF Transcript_56791/g.92458 Transcript_56791/m.92458 type:complete len:83 (+) Transcript_56791:252-500(+)
MCHIMGSFCLAWWSHANLADLKRFWWPRRTSQISIQLVNCYKMPQAIPLPGQTPIFALRFAMSSGQSASLVDDYYKRKKVMQ